MDTAETSFWRACLFESRQQVDAMSLKSRRSASRRLPWEYLSYKTSHDWQVLVLYSNTVGINILGGSGCHARHRCIRPNFSSADNTIAFNKQTSSRSHYECALSLYIRSRYLRPLVVVIRCYANPAWQTLFSFPPGVKSFTRSSKNVTRPFLFGPQWRLGRS